MIETILPPSVATFSTGDDLLDEELFPEELEALGNPVEKRRREFVTGRACARRALERLGVEPGPVPSGPKGEPVWPAGVVGSITHCRVLRACAVARTDDLHSVGIDAEVHEPLPPGVLESIANQRERLALAQAGGGGISLDRVFFSAKEAIYKAWFPLAERWLGFEDVHMTLSVPDRSFHGKLLVPGPEVAGRPLTEFRGRWLAEGDLVFAAVVIGGG